MRWKFIFALLILSTVGTAQELKNTKDESCRPSLTLSEFLLPEDETAARSAFSYFRQALLSGKKKQIAEQLKMPFDAVIRGYPVRFKDSNELLQRYAEVFTRFATSAIRMQSPDNLVVRRGAVATPDDVVTLEKRGGRFHVSGVRTRRDTPGPNEWLAKRLTCSPVVIEGTIVAYNWVSRSMPGFENIYIDHLLLDVSKVLRGQLDRTRIRVDFWGVAHLPDYNLPKEITEPGKTWRMYLRPAEQPPENREVCNDVQMTVSFVDEQGKEIEKKSVVVSVTPSTGPTSYSVLPCFQVERQFVTPVN
jgi:hypothetical protein